MTTANPHWGMTLDAFLAQDGIRDDARTEAATRVIAWQLRQQRKEAAPASNKPAGFKQTSD